MKRLAVSIGAGIAVLGVLFVTVPVSAHVLIKSTDASKAAILHIMPDDDPIAGEEAKLMFDAQGGVMRSDSEVTLRIQNSDTGEVSGVEVSTDGSFVTSKYIFPTQGLYTITYEVKNAEEVATFTQDMRVSRGIVGQGTSTVNHNWAEGLLIVAIAGIAVLGIIAWNHRKDIFKSSVL